MDFWQCDLCRDIACRSAFPVGLLQTCKTISHTFLKVHSNIIFMGVDIFWWGTGAHLSSAFQFFYVMYNIFKFVIAVVHVF
jgi:hypothetical protein